MSDGKEQKLFNQLLAVIVSFGAIAFVFYLMGAAMEGVGNAIAAVRW